MGDLQRSEAVGVALGSYADREQQETARALLDEVQRLPDKYQAPVRICYLEGKTNEQAAKLIGCPSGTVHSRLARARVMLRQRLAERAGHALSAAIPRVALMSFINERAEMDRPARLRSRTVGKTPWLHNLWHGP